MTVTGRLAPRLLVGNLVVAFTTADLALTGSLPVIFVLAFASGAFQSIVLLAFITVRAASAPDELLGRVGRRPGRSPSASSPSGC